MYVIKQGSIKYVLYVLFINLRIHSLVAKNDYMFCLLLSLKCSKESKVCCDLLVRI